MILGSRGSPLALAQTEWVRERLCGVQSGLTVTVRIIRTTGDRQQESPPDTFFGSPEAPGSVKGIFVKEIEEALLAGRIDAAVHSLKDLPTEHPEGLAVSSIPPREDPRDALVTREGVGLAGLPPGARLGTSSPRRAAQLRAERPDLILEPVRGNVDTRIKKMMEGQFHGVVLAAAGLARLGLLHGGRAGAAALSLLPEEICVPAVGQGALAIQTRVDDRTTRQIVSAIHDETAAAEVAAERSFLAALGGGCRVPVAALARASNGRMKIIGVVAAPDGSRLVRVSAEGAISEGVELGRKMAHEALGQGAGSLLEDGER